MSLGRLVASGIDLVTSDEWQYPPAELWVLGKKIIHQRSRVGIRVVVIKQKSLAIYLAALRNVGVRRKPIGR
jgi:hypothetical protein